MSTIYIDDTLLVVASKAECEANVIATTSLLRETGVTIHPVKSVFTPVQTIQYIGFMIDARSMTVSLPAEKMEKIRASCRALLQLERPTIRRVAEVVGQLVAAGPAVELGKLYYRVIDNDKSKALQQTGGNFEATMKLSPLAQEELSWWIANLPSVHKSFCPTPTALVIHSEASDEGWGGAIIGQDQKTGGQWSDAESKMHINEKELYAALLSLQSLAPHLTSFSL